MTGRAWTHFFMLLFVGALSVVALPHRPALAGPPAVTPAPDADDEASKLYEEGVKASKAEQWEKARDLFLQAWRIGRHWQIAANLGRVELKLGKHRDAAEHLAYFFKNAPSGLSEEEMQKARQLFREAREQVGEIKISTDVDGADLRVNGEPVGKAPLSDAVFVSPGDVVVEGRSEGYELKRVSVSVTAGSSHNVDLRLIPNQTLPPSPQGGASLEQKSGLRDALVVSGILVSGLLAGAGTISAVVSASGKAEAADVLKRFDADTPQCRANEDCRETYNAARHQYSAFAYASLWSFVGACAVGAGTVTYAMVGSSSLKATALVSPGGGMVVLTAGW